MAQFQDKPETEAFKPLVHVGSSFLKGVPAPQKTGFHRDFDPRRNLDARPGLAVPTMQWLCSLYILAQKILLFTPSVCGH